MKFRHLIPVVAVGLSPLHAAPAKVTVGQSGEDSAFKTRNTSPPASNDAATDATFKLLYGTPDPNGAKLDVLHDGKIPGSGDDPKSNFFLAPDSKEARLLIDLGKEIDVASIDTYSWHNGPRAAQTYDVYAADGKAEGFVAEPGKDADLEKSGWTLIANVDTSKRRPGQHAVDISGEESKPLGNYRYVLFNIKEPSTADRFSDTFFSEIDVVDAHGPELVRVEPPKRITKDFESKHGDYTYTLDSTEAPDMEEWCAEHLIPVMDEWYPKIIEMLPVEGVTPAKHITFTLKESTDLPGYLQGVPAYANGDSVTFNVGFMRKEKSGEAIGAGIHEVVHVVQFGGRSKNGRYARGRGAPTWVTEGAADYIRWFLYEPQAMGAEITKRNFNNAKYDSSYRITANFYKFVIDNYEKDLMRKLNLAVHEGYKEELWKEWTGKTLQELGDEWKEQNRKKLGIED
ncbi:hypothetical protein JIN85_16835 [Luteolibacter pohnpeiensis]|uniref:Secretory protein n=1 Tax=Luteolibacter pohnpeiensis TaxID=454153 RepID=A0A934SF80_9BACT|nr:basic secretory protein-like protein [Luteolibacter pohnpeiensis]MBK1884088.1 hypothetical protein [Luteolibacter pohnpeiensis]